LQSWELQLKEVAVSAAQVDSKNKIACGLQHLPCLVSLPVKEQQSREAIVGILK